MPERPGGLSPADADGDRHPDRDPDADPDGDAHRDPHLPSFDPRLLGDSQVIAIGLEVGDDGIVPISRASDALDGAHVCCDVSFVDTLEVGVSLPTFCFGCVGFAAIAGDVGSPDDVALIPPSSAVASSGVVVLRNCRTSNADGSTDPIGQGDFEQFLFAFHGQAVGPFGAAVSGKYSAAPHPAPGFEVAVDPLPIALPQVGRRRREREHTRRSSSGGRTARA